MSDKIDDGGTAFPIPQSVGSESDVCHERGEPGMTLRQYLACKFAAAWVMVLGARHINEAYDDKEAVIEANRLGLLQADAFLEQQKRFPGQDVFDVAEAVLGRRKGNAGR